MAERVEIRGGDLDGSILENAASEATLLRLVELMESRSRGQGSAQNASEVEVNRLRDIHSRSLKEGSKSVKFLGDSAKSAGSALTSLASGIAGFLAGLVKTADTTVASGLKAAFSGSTPKITEFTDILSATIPGFKTLGAVSSLLEGSITDFRELSQVGADLGNSLLSVKTRAAEANLPLEVFKKVIVDNGAVLATMGSTASQGALQFTRISGEVQKLRPQFARLGLSMEETAEYTASFLEQQQRTGRLSSMTEAQQIKGAQQYNLELDKMSRATGIQRKALDEANKRTMLDTRMRTALNRLQQNDPAGVTAFNARMEQLTAGGAGAFADGMRDLIAGAGIPLTEGARNVALAMQRAGIDINSIARDINLGLPGAVERFEEALSQGSDAAKGLSDEERRLATVTATQGRQIPQFMLLMLEPFDTLKDSAKVAAEEQKNATENNRKALADLDGVLLNVRNTLLNLFMPVLLKAESVAAEVVTKLGPDGEYMQAIKSFAHGVSERALEFLTTLKEQGASAAFSQLWRDLTEWGKPYIEKMWTEIAAYMKTVIQPFVQDMMKTVTNSLVQGLKELLTSAPVVGALVAGISLMFGMALMKSGVRSLGDIPGMARGGANRGRNRAMIDNPDGTWLDRLKGGAAGGAGAAARGLGKSAMRFIPGVGLVYGAYDIGSTILDSDLSSAEKTNQIAGTAGGMAGAAAGAGTGALIGSIIPGLGTAIGGAIGGAIGYFGGEWLGKSLTDVNNQSSNLKSMPTPDSKTTSTSEIPATTPQTDPGEIPIPKTEAPVTNTESLQQEKISTDLLTDLNNKMASLIELQTEANSNMKKIVGNTKGNLA